MDAVHRADRVWTVLWAGRKPGEGERNETVKFTAPSPDVGTPVSA